MNKEYLDISGEKYRAEANWNAVAAYCDRKGVTNLSQLDMLGTIGVGDVLTLMHCCLQEGERLEGREFPLTEQELGSRAHAGTIAQFIRLYVRQSQLPGGGDDGKK